MSAVGDVVTTTAGWIKRLPGRGRSPHVGATVIFPHAGGAAVGYRPLAAALAADGDTYIVQYPGRAERFADPAPATLPEMACELFDAADWSQVGPLRLFGHSMGALVAFEFARVAERRDTVVHTLWASAGPAPSVIAGLPDLPTDDAGLLADLTDMGGTDPRLLADEEFRVMLTDALRGDYRALNRYDRAPGETIRADIHALGGRSDHRVTADMLRAWVQHTRGAFTLSWYDGGHFYLTDHVANVAAQVNDDAR